MPVDNVLAVQELGECSSRATPLVVLHGLFGSSRNWRGVGRRLGKERRVVAMDLLNHGVSPRSADCSYERQAEAVFETLQALGLERVVLVGHSMGGKVAMLLAARRPELVERLLVLDIGPWRNASPEREFLQAMLDLPLAEIASRGDAERELLPRIGDRATTLFLLTNLVRREADSAGPPFRWQLGLEEIASDFDSIGAAAPSGPQSFHGPTHFLAGGSSDYLAADDLPRLRELFPRASLDVLEGVGHNVHVEGGERFVTWVEEKAPMPKSDGAS